MELTYDLRNGKFKDNLWDEKGKKCFGERQINFEREKNDFFFIDFIVFSDFFFNFFYFSAVVTLDWHKTNGYVCHDLSRKSGIFIFLGIPSQLEL